MKSIEITVNKTAERPDGINIKVVEPETDMEQRLACFMLQSYLHDAKHRKNLDLDLPQSFTVQYQRQGQFLVLSDPMAGGETYYTPGRPLAVLVIHVIGNRFEVAHADLTKRSSPAATAGSR